MNNIDSSTGEIVMYQPDETIRLEVRVDVAKFATTAKDGKTYQVEYYDLDMIMSIGYLSNRSSGVTATIYTRQLNQQQQLDLQRHNQQYPPIDIHNYQIIVER